MTCNVVESNMGRPSRSTTTATADAISPMSMTSWKASSGSCAKPREKKNGEDGLPIPPYAVYNIGGGQPENLLDFVNIIQEELVRGGVLPPTTTSRPIRNSCPCSWETFLPPMPMVRPLNGILGLRRRLRRGRG